MTFSRWNPLRDLLAVQQRVDRYVPGPTGWLPAVDLYETPEHYVIVAEVPGVTQEDIHIEAHDMQVTFSGMRRQCETEYEQYHRVERGHGAFSRTFQLPTAIDSAGVKADLKDGVLTVTSPKAASASRRIRIA